MYNTYKTLGEVKRGDFLYIVCGQEKRQNIHLDTVQVKRADKCRLGLCVDLVDGYTMDYPTTFTIYENMFDKTHFKSTHITRDFPYVVFTTIEEFERSDYCAIIRSEADYLYEKLMVSIEIGGTYKVCDDIVQLMGVEFDKYNPEKLILDVKVLVSYREPQKKPYSKRIKYCLDGNTVNFITNTFLFKIDSRIVSRTLKKIESEEEQLKNEIETLKTRLVQLKANEKRASDLILTLKNK